MDGGSIITLCDRYLPELVAHIPPDKAQKMRRQDLAHAIRTYVQEWTQRDQRELDPLTRRDLITALINNLMSRHDLPPALHAKEPAPVAPVIEAAPAVEIDKSAIPETMVTQAKPTATRSTVMAAKESLHPLLMERIDPSAAAKMSREALGRDLTGVIGELLSEKKMPLSLSERQELVTSLMDDMLGLGPLEPLLADESISEIMVNGPKQVWIEQKGKLQLTDLSFRDNAHVLSVAQRIVTAIGRRVDESTPLCDARLADGSRVNIIIPPLAIDGPTITIRKFSKKKITLDVMQKFGSISPQMATVLRIAARSRLNILISGGTGSGKTTLLNALSQMIDHSERIVTIEDAAELQLQQPHVVRLETRPANLEGEGEITMRDLLKNALRMRPDRIIVGETRGGEAIDMLQAMNTGHDGSFSTVHANRPREALSRLENMVGLAGVNLAPRAIRQQIASAIDMIVQVSRMRDGGRRVTHISEVLGMEGEVVTMQDLFTTEVRSDTADKLQVEFVNHGLRPHFLPKAAYYGLDKQLLEILLAMDMDFIVMAMGIGAVVVTVLLVLDHGAQSKTLNKRLKRVKHGEGGETPAEKIEKLSLKRDTKDSGIPFLDRFIKSGFANPQKLRTRLARTGKNITVSEYLLITALCVAVFFALFNVLLGLKLVPSLLIAVTLGVFGPHMWIGMMGRKRAKNFIKFFPESIDAMVRSIKSGLPIAEAINVVAQEMPDPVGPEFGNIRDGVRMGRSLEASMWEVAKRLDIPEYRYLIIALSIQRETGGNLAETLQNVAEVLRKRRQLKLKIKAMSSEAKASAMILGALPFIVIGVLSLVAGSYVALLVTDPRGHILCGIAASMLGGGIWIMSQMINFEI